MIKKYLILFVLLQLSLINLKVLANISIILSIDDEIITNYDISKESGYLKILNPQLSKLNQSKILELSKNSLINEIIKKKEVEKFIDIKNDNIDFISEYLKNIYLQLGYKNKNELENALIKNESYNLDQLKKKIEIELYWNEIIFNKYNNQVKIDMEKLIKKIDNAVNKKQKEFELSEIIFQKKKDEEVDQTFKNILDSISEIGFENTANIYSLSETAKFGGKVGWINEKKLSKIILDEINLLSENDISNVIKIKNNFVILKINKIRLLATEIDKDKMLQDLINFEQKKQLDQFSKIYLEKLILNKKIYEK